jgi:hypothetical protein
MRRTLHFVAAADVRWMLRLLTPRVIANSWLASRRRAMFKGFIQSRAMVGETVLEKAEME